MDHLWDGSKLFEDVLKHQLPSCFERTAETWVISDVTGRCHALSETQLHACLQVTQICSRTCLLGDDLATGHAGKQLTEIL